MWMRKKLVCVCSTLFEGLTASGMDSKLTPVLLLEATCSEIQPVSLVTLAVSHFKQGTCQVYSTVQFGHFELHILRSSLAFMWHPLSFVCLSTLHTKMPLLCQFFIDSVLYDRSKDGAHNLFALFKMLLHQFFSMVASDKFHDV